MPSDTFFSFIPLIAGSVFFAIGINIITHFIRFRAIAERAIGHVKLIEKYIGYSSSTGSNSRTATTYYRPVIEYIYNGETRTTVGISVSEIRHKLKQKVAVLLNVSEDGKKIQSMVDDPLQLFLGGIFACVGCVAICVFIFGLGGSWITALVVASAMVGIGHMISGLMLNFNEAFDDNGDQWIAKTDSTLIDTQNEYMKEISSYGFVGLIMGFILLFVSFAIMYYGYNELPAELTSLIFNDFNTFWTSMTEGKLKEDEENALIIVGIGIFFFLASLRSIYYVNKKMGGALRR